MEVILKKDFITLGYEGDICKVKERICKKLSYSKKYSRN